MLLSLLEALRQSGIRVGTRELLDAHAALQAGLPAMEPAAMHGLLRAIWIKDERHYDRFDRVFGAWWQGVAQVADSLATEVPEDWLRAEWMRRLSAEEQAQIQSLGGLEALLQAFRERLAEQRERHAGGNRWVGTGGSSPFGHGGWHPEGLRVGGSGGQGRAVKVWESRRYRALASDAPLNDRNLQLALRQLRQFARQGRADELDIQATIQATAAEGGLLQLQLRPERHNAVKILLLLDVGGSMDAHVAICEQLFTAVRGEFKRLSHCYFHNCMYEKLWTGDGRHARGSIDSLTLLRTHPPDTRVIIVGDAAMAPYELSEPGGSVDYVNAEAGKVWLQRWVDRFPHLVWLNPVAEAQWAHTQSTRMIQQLIGPRMYPLTTDGLAAATRELRR